jgi:hypothetical protein
LTAIDPAAYFVGLTFGYNPNRPNYMLAFSGQRLILGQHTRLKPTNRKLRETLLLTDKTQDEAALADQPVPTAVGTNRDKTHQAVNLEDWNELEVSVRQGVIRCYLNGEFYFDYTEPDKTMLEGSIALSGHKCSGLFKDPLYSGGEEELK